MQFLLLPVVGASATLDPEIGEPADFKRGQYRVRCKYLLLFCVAKSNPELDIGFIEIAVFYGSPKRICFFFFFLQ